MDVGTVFSRRAGGAADSPPELPTDRQQQRSMPLGPTTSVRFDHERRRERAAGT
jgi:tartrate dehydratase beta subunit/fumarate hydratase class I family protein